MTDSLFHASEQSRYDRLRQLGWREVLPGIWLSAGGGRFVEAEAIAWLERHEREQHGSTN